MKRFQYLFKMNRIEGLRLPVELGAVHALTLCIQLSFSKQPLTLSYVVAGII